jgi:hypothetical protein
MFQGLSLDQAPPFRSPLKFFQTAPIFMILAFISLFLSDSYDLASLNVIATIHFITIGYMVMMIFGALQQMLPVVAAVAIPRPAFISSVTYILLLFGTLCFGIGFILYNQILLFVASISLSISILFFGLVVLLQLLKVQNKSYIVQGMLIANIFLIVAFCFGIYLLISHTTADISAYHHYIAILHYNYIVFGFVTILIFAITFQVVPMFWVASDFKKWQQAILIYALVAILIFYPLSYYLGFDLTFLYKYDVGSVLLIFCFLTYQKLKSRRRKLKDLTVYFYYSSIVFLAISVIYWWLMDIVNLPMMGFGILFGLGFVVTIINGMLYKIIPFLTWFHSNSEGIFNIPTMRDMISIRSITIQFYLHIAGVIILLIGSILDTTLIIKIASIIFILSNLLLLINITKASRLYTHRTA